MLIQNKYLSKQKGLSIVELMVSILIGLIILAGVVQVVITSKTSFMGQEEMSFIQENARYAVSVVGKDIQNAGHWGCAGPQAKAAMVGRVDNDDAATFMAFSALNGYEGSDAGAPVPAAFSGKIRATKDADNEKIQPDSLVLRGLQGQTYTVDSHAAGTAGTLTLNTAHSFDVDDYIGVIDGDCKRFGVFRASGKSGKAINYDADKNFVAAIKSTVDQGIECIEEKRVDGVVSYVLKETCSGVPGSPQVYTKAAMVMPYQAKAFYIGDSSVFGSDVPALKRAVLKGGKLVEEEIALGVENMQILYGQMDGAKIQYHKADSVTDWAAVVAVRVDLLFRSQTPMLPAAQKQEDLLENTYDDRFARQVVSSTFRLRNRI